MLHAIYVWKRKRAETKNAYENSYDAAVAEYLNHAEVN